MYESGRDSGQKLEPVSKTGSGIRLTPALACAAALIVHTCCLSAPTQNTDRPNVVVILIDDMGFSDLGCYGSEVPTPNIDALAADGVRFTQFYNTARCSPSRPHS